MAITDQLPAIGKGVKMRRSAIAVCGSDAAASVSSQAALLFESLEARQLLSTSAVGVGAFFDGSYLTPYSLEAVIQDSGAIFGSVRHAGSSGAGAPQQIGVDSVQFLPGGRYVPHFRSTFTPYQTINGAQFFNGQSYPVGWFSGLDSGYSRAEFAMLVERSDALTIGDLAGSWQMNSVVVTETTALGAWGSLSVSGTTVNRTTHATGQPTHNDVVSVTSVQANGAIRLSDGIYAWAAKSERTVVAADLNGSDGQVSVNVVFRTSSSRTMGQLAGGYRVGFAATGALATSLNGRSAALVTSYLQLNANGSFALYDLGQYDAGGRTPTGSGQWQLAGDTVTLLQSGGRRWTYAVSADNVSLIPRFTAQGAGQQDVLCGLATLVAAPTRSLFSVARNDPGAGSRLYTLEDHDQWRSIDLVAKAGGPTITGKVVTWTDPKDGLVYAAAQAGTSLSLYRRDANGAWSRRDLRSTTPGAQVISSNLDFMIGGDSRVRITGLTSSGDLVLYAQTGTPNVAGEYTWSFTNIAEVELRGNGGAMPAFVGATVNYATAWNGLNVAGRDSSGNIWSVWWAPGAAHWSASNLTSSFGANPIAGGLAVYLTPWGGINIAGISTLGQLEVTWWVPGFGGNWAHSNLTAEANGPQLTAESVSSYVSSWGGLNIVGADSTTGEIKVYWWAPARTAEGWAVTSFTDAVGSQTPRPTHGIQGLAPADNSLNVFGISGTGRLLRYFWEPGFDGAWQYQDVSNLATPA